VQLDNIFAIPTAKGWDAEITGDVLAGIVAAPALAIPLLGAGAAAAYIRSIGDNYVRAITAVLDTATEEERQNPAFLHQRIKEEMQKNHAQRRERRRARMDKATESGVST